MTPTLRLCLAAAAALTLLGACASDAPTVDDGAATSPAAHVHDDPHADAPTLALTADALAALPGGVLRVEQVGPIRQLGLLFDADGVDELLFRARIAGHWSAPSPAEITWREGRLYAARIVLDADADAIEILDADRLEFVRADAWPTVVADLDRPLARDLPVEQPAPPLAIDLPDDGVRTLGAAVEEPGWVVSRSAWGARNAGTICGSPHTPRRMTVHHTVTPTPDSSSVPARMRQIQAYHIDSNGWCDIGYHFLTGADGNVYEGRKSHDHIGSHAGGGNTDNVGISFIGTFTSIVPPDNQMDAGGRIIGWLASTYSIALNRTNVLGHRQVGTTSTSCPGDVLYAKLTRLIEIAGGSTTPDPVETWDVAIDVRWIGPGNPLDTGSSAALSDIWPGDTFQAEILVTNSSSGPIRGVELGYFIESPWLRATNYVIQTDVPARDRATWLVNSADSDAGNPARDGLGASGSLIMHAFAAGETKRVLLDLTAVAPSIGEADHPDVRGWLRVITDVYGPQDDFFAEPATNRIGRNVRDYAELDVLSRDAWFFDSTASDADTEGWTPCSADVNRAVLNTEDGMLAVRAAGPAPCVASPSWTAVDANTYDHAVIELRSYAGPQRATLRWAREGEGIDAARAVSFEVPGDGALRTLVVPVGQHPDWTGRVTRLEWVPADDSPFPETGAEAWHDTGFVYFQAAGSRVTTGGGVYADIGPVELLGATVEPTPDAGMPDAGAPDTGLPDASEPDTSFPDAAAETGPDAEFDAGALPDVAGDSDRGPTRAPPGSETSVRSPGCAAAPGAGAAWLLLAAPALVRRRRR